MKKLLLATLLVIMTPPILSIAGSLPEAVPADSEKQVPPSNEEQAVNESNNNKEKVDQISESKETEPRLPQEPWSHLFRESSHHDR